MAIDEDEFSRAYVRRFLREREAARANGEEYPASQQLGADAQVLDFWPEWFRKRGVHQLEALRQERHDRT
jgi:hypothetical protein